ncbi:MAG: prolipoprotein diacylglyceryl transferase [Solirubrobacterales bacterium]|nr:prolipoprotein diacylglyceryl transferase [Solirubrobacterales bacterium]
MLPEISIGPITLQTFGLMFALSFVVAGMIVHRRFVETGRSPDWAYEMTFAALAGGLIGARLYFLVDNYDTVRDDLLGSVFSGSGLTWYGGAAGGAIGVLLWAWWRKTANLFLCDAAAPALAAGYAVGRIGCQLSGDGDYGKPWDGPWAMGYPDGTVPTPPGVMVHPTPIYESLTMALVAVVLWRLRDRFRFGVLFAIYLMFAGTERLLVEFLRTNDRVALGLTAAQLESLAVIAAGAIAILVVRHRHGTLARPPEQTTSVTPTAAA